MKRVWFAVAFLALSLSICIAEQHFINDFYNNMCKNIDTAIEYNLSGDERLGEAVDDLKDYWEKHNDLIFTMTNHGVLDELSAEIQALNTDKIDNELYRVKGTLNVFYENQRITFANVF